MANQKAQVVPAASCGLFAARKQDTLRAPKDQDEVEVGYSQSCRHRVLCGSGAGAGA